MKKVGFEGVLPSGVKQSEASALWCQCSVVYVYSLLWLKFLLKIQTKHTAGNRFQAGLGSMLKNEMDKEGWVCFPLINNNSGRGSIEMI